MLLIGFRLSPRSSTRCRGVTPFCVVGACPGRPGERFRRPHTELPNCTAHCAVTRSTRRRGESGGRRASGCSRDGRRGRPASPARHGRAPGRTRPGRRPCCRREEQAELVEFVGHRPGVPACLRGDDLDRESAHQLAFSISQGPVDLGHRSSVHSVGTLSPGSAINVAVNAASSSNTWRCTTINAGRPTRTTACRRRRGMHDDAVLAGPAAVGDPLRPVHRVEMVDGVLKQRLYPAGDRVIVDRVGHGCSVLARRFSADFSACRRHACACLCCCELPGSGWFARRVDRRGGDDARFPAHEISQSSAIRERNPHASLLIGASTDRGA